MFNHKGMLADVSHLLHCRAYCNISSKARLNIKCSGTYNSESATSREIQRHIDFGVTPIQIILPEVLEMQLVHQIERLSHPNFSKTVSYPFVPCAQPASCWSICTKHTFTTTFQCSEGRVMWKIGFQIGCSTSSYCFHSSVTVGIIIADTGLLHLPAYWSHIPGLFCIYNVKMSWLILTSVGKDQCAAAQLDSQTMTPLEGKSYTTPGRSLKASSHWPAPHITQRC